MPVELLLLTKPECELSTSSCPLALQSQIRYINDTDYRASMEGLIAAEGYHAGAIRELLIQQAAAAVPPYGLSVNQIAQVIFPHCSVVFSASKLCTGTALSLCILRLAHFREKNTVQPCAMRRLTYCGQ